MEKPLHKNLTDDQLASLCAWRAEGQQYSWIAHELEKAYGVVISDEGVRRAWNKYGDAYTIDDPKTSFDTIKAAHRAKRTNSGTARENRIILDAIKEHEDILEALRPTIAKLRPGKTLRTEVVKQKGRTDMTVEALLSDIHFGKKTDTFNYEVCRKRLRQFTATLRQEIARKRELYNVERLIVSLNGDIIENSMMHGAESARSCEFENPEQVRVAIECLWQDVLVPLYSEGLPVTVLAVGGNHDRTDEKKTMIDPTKNGYAWIIYSVLQMLTAQAGYDFVKWQIEDGAFLTYDVYGNTYLLEHGDVPKSCDRGPMVTHLNKRSAQLGTHLSGIRVGHWHTYCAYENGRVIVNGSVPGGDGYSDTLGFDSQPSQVINFYVRTKNRPSSFYYSFMVQLT